jgi:predicted alpha/beta-fold hydrolase
VQTVLGNIFKGTIPRVPVIRRQVPLPDGDRLMLHDSQPPTWQKGNPIVLAVHGLGGSHESGNMIRLLGLLIPHGLRVVRMDLRGAGEGAALAKRTYNAACSEDVRAAAELIHRDDPASPLLLAGYSLGGNIVLKLAGEASQKPVPNLKAVAALAPPINLERCAAMLRESSFYDRFFVREILAQVNQIHRLNPELPRPRFPRKLSMRMFDELYTAPRGGFKDAVDYYRQGAALPWMEKICVPTFVLTAADDPFVDADSFRELPVRPHYEVHIAERGGHLGFLGWDGKGGFRWGERQLADWLIAKAQGDTK